jgi:hypothetical protein
MNVVAALNWVGVLYGVVKPASGAGWALRLLLGEPGNDQTAGQACVASAHLSVKPGAVHDPAVAAGQHWLVLT